MLNTRFKKIFLNSSVATITTALFKIGLRNQFIQSDPIFANNGVGLYVDGIVLR